MDIRTWMDLNKQPCFAECCLKCKIPISVICEHYDPNESHSRASILEYIKYHSWCARATIGVLSCHRRDFGEAATSCKESWVSWNWNWSYPESRRCQCVYFIHRKTGRIPLREFIPYHVRFIQDKESTMRKRLIMIAFCKGLLTLRRSMDPCEAHSTPVVCEPSNSTYVYTKASKPPIRMRRHRRNAKRRCRC